MTHEANDPAVLELRRYILHPGRRDALVALFEREFVETQEAHGMTVLGQFRDLDHADRFVWLRGFADMASRPGALAAFYDGAVWRAHREAANATMIDSDDVLLLRPAWPGAGAALRGGARADVGAGAAPPGLLLATLLHLRAPADAGLLALCRGPWSAAFAAAGAERIAWYVTEPAANNFPRLPVREGEHVVVSLALFRDRRASDDFERGSTASRDLDATLARQLLRPLERLRLAPTPRSAIHAGATP